MDVGAGALTLLRACVLWAAGAWAAKYVRYPCIVALGGVVREGTPHIEYVAGEAARVLNIVAIQHTIPVGFGVLTVDSMDQALARAGGEAGNKGQEAAAAAIQTADALAQLRDAHASS